MTFSSTVMSLMTCTIWKVRTMPSLPMACGFWLVMSLPLKSTRPLSTW